MLTKHPIVTSSKHYKNAGMQSLRCESGGRKPRSTEACLDSHTEQFTPESGADAGYGGAKHRKGSKVHIAVDTLMLFHYLAFVSIILSRIFLLLNSTP